MNVRPGVRAFGEAMEAKLKRDDERKPGWTPSVDFDRSDALLKLREEVRELHSALMNLPHNFRGIICGCGHTFCEHHLADITAEQKADVTQECADVGNLAMMISDMVNGMPHGPRGKA
jgi:hypothetical protein